MEALLTSTLIDASGNTVPTASVVAKGGVFGLYFSAHWCPPCRGFTPVLSQWYKDFTAANPDKPLHIIFVSSDRSQADFDGYHKEMSFHAMPFSEREKKAALSGAFGVRGIPTLIFLDADGNTLSKDGRSIVGSDPQGKNYPWTPKPLSETLAGPLVNSKGEQVDYSTLKGKYVSFYFSASWCPPCHHFTPKLAEAYTAAKAADKPWEVVFVSADRSEDQFDTYLGGMPWLALPFEDPRGDALNAHFEVDGIPTLVLLSPDGKTLTTELRAEIEEDPTAANFPWPKKALYPLRAGVNAINDKPTLAVLTDGSAAQVDAARSALQPAAEAELARGDGARVAFTYAEDHEADKELVQRLLGLLGRKGAALPVAVLFNVPNQTRYDLDAAEFTAEGVAGVVARLADKSLALRPLRGESEDDDDDDGHGCTDDHCGDCH